MGANIHAGRDEKLTFNKSWPKLIGSIVVVIVIVDTNIAKSRNIGIGVLYMYATKQSKPQKTIYVCFKSLRTAHEHYKSCVFHWPHLLTTPIDHTYHSHVLLILRMLNLQTGKGS